MDKIYVLNFSDSGIYCTYATKDAAKKVLWESYCDEILPNINEADRETYYAEDLQTFETGDYIIDYGWVEEVTFVEE